MTACVIDGCARPLKARGLCSVHYKAAWRAGTLDEFEHTPRGTLDEFVARLHADGLSAAQIAEQAGCTTRTVQRWRTAQGVAQPLPPTRNPDEFPTRLEQARQLLEDGASYNEVIRTLHMHKRTLQRHFPGMGWSSVEGSRLGAFITRMQRETNRKAAA